MSTLEYHFDSVCVHLFVSGGQYSGGWQLDQKHGHGKFVLPNGRVIEGEFSDDKMVGNNSFGEGNVSPVLRPGTPLGNIVGKCC